MANKETTFQKSHLLALCLVLAAGWALRAWVEFSTALPPGVNGAYYPVQVRSILLTGTPSIADFPSLFYIQALVGSIPWMVGGESALLFSTRITDIFLPILIAIPAFLFVQEFFPEGKKSWKAVFVILIVGLFAVLNGSLLRMLGDFQKNADGLPLSLTYAYFLYQTLETGKRKPLIWAGVFFALTLMTHIGVAGMTIVLTGITLFVYFVQQPKRKKTLLVILSLLAVMLVVLALVYIFDPTRITRLLGSKLDPSSLFEDSAIKRWLFMISGKEAVYHEGDIPMLIGNLLGVLSTPWLLDWGVLRKTIFCLVCK